MNDEWAEAVRMFGDLVLCLDDSFWFCMQWFPIRTAPVHASRRRPIENLWAPPFNGGYDAAADEWRPMMDDAAADDSNALQHRYHMWPYVNGGAVPSCCATVLRKETEKKASYS
jgi:hypothetical protein